MPGGIAIVINKTNQRIMEFIWRSKYRWDIREQQNKFDIAYVEIRNVTEDWQTKRQTSWTGNQMGIKH